MAVTRPLDDAAELAGLLADAGLDPLIIPLTRITVPDDEAAFIRAVSRLDYEWIVFTSANAVRSFAARRAAIPPRVRIAAVGPATAAAVLERLRRRPEVIPAQFTGSALAPAMLQVAPLHGARVLWPRAEAAHSDLGEALARAGAVLDDPVAYRTVPDPAAAALLVAMVSRNEVDVITFTAPSAIACFADAWTGTATCIIAVIGPSTATAALARGLPVHIQPEQPVISALAHAVARYSVTRTPPRRSRDEGS